MRNLTRRSFLLATAAATAAGCGGGSGRSVSGPGEASPTLGEDTTAAFGGADVADAIQELYERAKANGEREVVVYGATAEAKKPVFDVFSQRFPEITVVTQELFGPQLVARINQEVASGKRVGDISATGSTTTLLFYQRGYFDVGWSPVNADTVEPTYVGPEKAFLADSLSPFTIIYNTQQVSPEEAPKGWADLLDPRYKGKLVIADPTVSGPSVDIFAHMIYDGRFTRDYVERTAAQQPQLSPSPSVFENAVATGNKWVGWPDSYLAAAQAKEKGAPIEIVFPQSDGNYLGPTYAGVLTDGPHPNAARLLVTWELTPEGTSTLAANNVYSAVKGAKPPAGLPPFDQIDRFKEFPLDEAEAQINKHIELAKEIFA